MVMFSFMQQPSESNVHLLPFMLPVGDDELRGLYQKVKTAMFGVHQRNSSKELERIATEWLVLNTVIHPATLITYSFLYNTYA